MSMSPVTAADHGGSLPLVSISCPDAGEPIKAEDIRAPVAALLAETDDIRTNATTGLANKLNRNGDTSTGLQTFAAGATVSPGQDLTLDDVSVQGVVGFSTLGRVWLAGRKQLWRGRLGLADASQTVGVDNGDRFTLSATNAAPRTITLQSTTIVPEIGETLAFFWNPGTAGGSGTQYTFIREGGTVVATFVGAQVADTGAVYAEFEYMRISTGPDVYAWKLGTHSGTPNEYVPPVPGPESWNSYGVVPGVGA
jgi:hypothetical protein